MSLFILCYYAENYIFVCYAERHYAECLYADRRGAKILSTQFPELALSESKYRRRLVKLGPADALVVDEVS